MSLTVFEWCKSDEKFSKRAVTCMRNSLFCRYSLTKERYFMGERSCSAAKILRR